jgi:hypothetical protein
MDKDTYEIGDHIEFLLFGNMPGKGEFVGFYEDLMLQIRLTDTPASYYRNGDIILINEGEITKHE